MQPGQRVGPYEVVGELGRGAMGVVLEVRHPQAQQRLALKLQLDDEPQFTERFARETRVQEFLGRHPHVLGCLDVGRHGSHPYLVMPLVTGGTLADWLRDGRPTAEIARRLVEVARALHFAHEAGVVHRDVKPSNVLLDEQGQALLADFGIAKNLQERSLTQTGAAIGTPHCMAPEQAGGEQVDRRTDVYALGVILYQALAGRVPFQGTQVELVKKILMDPPPPPSSVNPGADPALEAVCLRAMAKAPAARYPTAEAFAQAVEVALGLRKGEDPAAPARGASRLLVVGAAAAALAAGLGLGFVGGRAAPAEAAEVASPAEVAPPAPVPAPPPKAAPPVEDLLERAAELAAAGRAADGARVLLDALAREDASPGAGDPAQRVAWAERALDLDERAVYDRGADVGRTLAAAALAALASCRGQAASEADLIDLARERLHQARLCDPELDLTPGARHLARLSASASEELRLVRLAARPWSRTLPIDVVGPFLAMPVDAAAARAARPNASHSIEALAQGKAPAYPRAWARLLFEAAADWGAFRALVQEALLWNPGFRALYFELGRYDTSSLAQSGLSPRSERCLELATECEDGSEARYYQCGLRTALGWGEEAADAALALVEDHRRLNKPLHAWTWRTVGAALASSPRPQDARRALAIVEEHGDAFADGPRSPLEALLVKLQAHRTLGEDAEVAQVEAALRARLREVRTP